METKLTSLVHAAELKIENIYCLKWLIISFLLTFISHRYNFFLLKRGIILFEIRNRVNFPTKQILQAPIEKNKKKKKKEKKKRCFRKEFMSFV